MSFCSVLKVSLYHFHVLLDVKQIFRDVVLQENISVDCHKIFKLGRLRVFPLWLSPSFVMRSVRHAWHKKWSHELLAPTFFLRGFLSRHARRTKRNRDYLWSTNFAHLFTTHRIRWKLNQDMNNGLFDLLWLRFAKQSRSVGLHGLEIATWTCHFIVFTCQLTDRCTYTA